MKSVLSCGSGICVFDVWLGLVLLKNLESVMPISAVPSLWFPVHERAPSWWKICSWVQTWAGVRTVHWAGLDADAEFGVFPCGLSERRLSRSRSGSELSKVEKTMFARCLFRLVICTERTAA